MALYARVEKDQVVEIVERDERQMAAFKAAGNPKASAYLPVIVEQKKPAVPEGQIAERGDPVVDDGTVFVGWVLRDKTDDEIAADEDRRDRQALKADAVMDKLHAEINGTSSLTAAQFRVLVARCLLYLIRRSM
jgi:hypothetical protein